MEKSAWGYRVPLKDVVSICEVSCKPGAEELASRVQGMFDRKMKTDDALVDVIRDATELCTESEIFQAGSISVSLIGSGKLSLTL